MPLAITCSSARWNNGASAAEPRKEKEVRRPVPGGDSSAPQTDCRAGDREWPLTIGPRGVNVTVAKNLAWWAIKRLVEFRLDQSVSVLIRRSQWPCRREFCVLPGSAVPILSGH
jgi:hypothetical protein